jgi:hypothetical protein
MASLAQTEKALNIATRVDYLRSAVTNATQAKNRPSSALASLSQQLTVSLPSEGYQDLLDIAVIQHRAMEKMMSPPLSIIYPSVEFPAISKLQSKLLGISELYNDIASAFCLWDINLLLIQAARYESIDLALRLWKSFIYR